MKACDISRSRKSRTDTRPAPESSPSRMGQIEPWFQATLSLHCICKDLHRYWCPLWGQRKHPLCTSSFRFSWGEFGNLHVEWGLCSDCLVLLLTASPSAPPAASALSVWLAFSEILCYTLLLPFAVVFCFFTSYQKPGHLGFPSSLPWLLIHLANLNASLNVGPSVSAVHRHFQWAFPWALVWTSHLLYNTLFLDAI